LKFKVDLTCAQNPSDKKNRNRQRSASSNKGERKRRPGREKGKIVSDGVKTGTRERKASKNKVREKVPWRGTPPTGQVL